MNEINEVMALSPDEIMAAPAKRDILIDYLNQLRRSKGKTARVTQDAVPTLEALNLKPKSTFKLKRI